MSDETQDDTRDDRAARTRRLAGEARAGDPSPEPAPAPEPTPARSRASRAKTTRAAAKPPAPAPVEQAAPATVDPTAQIAPAQVTSPAEVQVTATRPSPRPRTTSEPQPTRATAPAAEPATRPASRPPASPPPASSPPASPPPSPAPARTPAPVLGHVATGPISADDHREQFVRAYLRHRVGERLAGFEQARARYTSARRWTTAGAVLLYTAAAALGAVAVADAPRRELWAFLAAVAAAGATAVAVYEAAFSFRALSRRSANGVALLHLLQAHGAPEGEDGVTAFRTEVESVLRHSE
ncbi:hypothetical protein [Saccharothrix sp. Mg75]|uniref:hypothetical protein n=1 Tax=Saccharothrix sp. Mg75 TaxID=3445357 RepID=UPI003EE8B439